jgi:hypothetical protein
MRKTAKKRQSGGSAIIVAFSLVMLGAIAAMAINMGQIMMVRGQLQNAVDAGALAGAKSLGASLVALNNARISAQDFVNRHQDGNEQLLVDLNPANEPTGDIVLGNWDFETRTFQPLNPVTDGEARYVNAVRVHAGRGNGQNSPLPVVLQGFFAQTEVSLGAEAIAVGGGPFEGCSIPLVFPDCLVVNPADNSLWCDRTLVFRDDNTDNVGFTSLSLDNPNTALLRNILSDPDHCMTARIGDSIGVSNGNNLSPVRRDLLDYVGEEVTIPIVDSPDGSYPTCDFKFNQHHTIVGFARVMIQNVTAPPEQAVYLDFLCDQGGGDDDAMGGGINFGTTAPQVRLVR